MNRNEFMRELEYLLQDIPEEEKEEALAYYRDYLEEAGDEHEQEAIREFGSPERVAAIIRSDLSGNLEDGGEFTESGYQDERFRDPNYQVAKRRELPETSAWESHETTGKQDRKPARGGSLSGNLLKWGGILILCMIFLPLAFGLGGSLIAAVSGVLVAAVAILVLIGVLTAAACIGAVAILVVGFGLVFAQPVGGMTVLGIGVLVLGMALIGLAVSVWVYGTVIPACIRGILNGLNRLFHRERGRRA